MFSEHTLKLIFCFFTDLTQQMLRGEDVVQLVEQSHPNLLCRGSNLVILIFTSVVFG